MHSALLPIFGSAIAAGAMFTAALNDQPGYTAPRVQLQRAVNYDAVESEPNIVPALTLPNGPLPDYELGTRFAHAQDGQAAQPAAFHPDDLSVSGGEAQAQTDGTAQPLKVGIVDHQGGGQIDDLAHRPDPATQLGETGVQRPRFDRDAELDNADRAHDPYVDHAVGEAAGVQTGA
jgi:hypothetical protein